MDFGQKLKEYNLDPLRAQGVDTLQVNLGYRCNMACRHCHVQAGPDRPEMMGAETVEQVLDVLKGNPGLTLDLTGGAPEMNPRFRHLVREARKLGIRVNCRSNLSVLLEEPARGMPEFLRDQAVEITASLPCYTEKVVDTIRGKDAFRKSINALRALNRLGFGRDREALRLNLVFNPEGPFLPAPQAQLEEAYKKELWDKYDVTFDRLLAFSNMPIGRFREFLAREGHLDRYLARLAGAFNPETVPSVMCRRMVNVRWDGALFDCDFNQALGIGLRGKAPRHVRDFDPGRLSEREIAIGDHCFGCTAGQGFT